MSCPHILTSLSGEEITQSTAWEEYRRKEILALFSTFVYGRRPVERPQDMTFSVTDTIKGFNGQAVTYNEISVHFANYSFRVQGFVPDCKKPVPAFVFIMHEYQEEHSDLLKKPDCDYVPVSAVTARGYAVFVLHNSDIYKEFYRHKIHFNDGVFGVFGPCADKRHGDEWAAISAWSWGASRIMDYIETDPRIDKSAVAVAGHSRSGKAALWCAANDQRFAMAVSNASGCMGASVLRGKSGEHIKDINITDWFCENFLRFNECEELLPVDQHMLLALIAPRLLYVESCSEDDWADPKNERLACRLASEVYEKIYHLPGAVLPQEPVKTDTVYHEGCIGYHMKTGEHSITPYDWKCVMDFWKKKR